MRTRATAGANLEVGARNDDEDLWEVWTIWVRKKRTESRTAKNGQGPFLWARPLDRSGQPQTGNILIT